MSDRVAVIQDGVRGIHAGDATGNYATLCGLDGDDPDQHVQQSMSIVKRGEKINCDQCRSIWSKARQYRISDFEEKP